MIMIYSNKPFLALLSYRAFTLFIFIQTLVLPCFTNTNHISYFNQKTHSGTLSCWKALQSVNSWISNYNLLSCTAPCPELSSPWNTPNAYNKLKSLSKTLPSWQSLEYLIINSFSNSLFFWFLLALPSVLACRSTISRITSPKPFEKHWPAQNHWTTCQETFLSASCLSCTAPCPELSSPRNTLYCL